MRRRQFIVLAASAGCAFAARAQPANRQKRIAIVAPARSVDELKSNPYYKAFVDELARRGLAEGRNLAVDRYSGGAQTDAYADVARTVVATHPDAILTAAPPMTFALRAATPTIPIVTMIGDPVAAGVAASLARPGGNVTGVTVDAGIQLHGKRLELLLETKPQASRLAYLTSSSGWKQIQAGMVREAAQTARLTLTHIDLGTTLNEAAYAAAFAQIMDAKSDVLLVSDEPEHLSNSVALVDVAARTQLPAMYPFRDLVLAGGLMAYYRDLADGFRQAAEQMARILGGENPASMPFRQPTNFKLSINTKTAQKIGVTIPPTLFAGADEVIE